VRSMLQVPRLQGSRAPVPSLMRAPIRLMVGAPSFVKDGEKKGQKTVVVEQPIEDLDTEKLKVETDGKRPYGWLDETGMTPHDKFTEEEIAIMKGRPIVYQLPLYNHPKRMDKIKALDDDRKYKLLAPYGCAFYSARILAQGRLESATKLKLQHRKVGVVVSTARSKTVTVVVRQMRWSMKYRYKYWRSRKFWAHDEFNLAKRGDVVVIQHWKHTHNGKNFTVVQNYGNKLIKEGTERAEKMKQLINDVKMDPDVYRYEPASRQYTRTRKKLIKMRERAAKPRKNLSKVRRLRKIANE